MGTRTKPRVARLQTPEADAKFSLGDLISHIEDDIPDLMKEAAKAAKGGNSQTLVAIVNLLTKYADQQGSDKASDILSKIVDLRKASLERQEVA